MATRVIEVLVDDLDGSTEDVDTVQFSLDNHVYEIDLSANNASRLRDKLARFVEAATHIKPQQGRRVTKKTISTPNSKEQVRAVRDWARQNGFEVSERGRIPRNVLDAFNEAH